MKTIEIDGFQVNMPNVKALYRLNQLQQQVNQLYELNVHEDVIEYLLRPIEDVLKKCGINLQELDY